MSPEAILTLIASPVLGTAAAKFWQWWTTRDATRLAATATERADLITELRASRAASDARATQAQERADALVAALHALTSESAKGNGAITSLADSVNGHALREEGALAAILELLRASGPPAPTTGEQPRASMLPPLPTRAPTPPRGGR